MIEREYNIITGQLQTLNHFNQNRNQSSKNVDFITHQEKKNYNNITRPNFPSLGRSKDYNKQLSSEVKSAQTLQNYHKVSQLESRPKKLTNSVSTEYNIVNNTRSNCPVYDKNLLANTKINYRHDAISKICDLGGINARNLNEEYQQKITKNNWAFHRNKGSCAEILEIGKSYGPKAKLFRKFK